VVLVFVVSPSEFRDTRVYDRVEISLWKSDFVRASKCF